VGGQSQFNVSGEHAKLPDVMKAVASTWTFFPLLGVQGALGHTFTKSEDHWGVDTVVLISMP
jgi:hypothetical protein